MDKLKQLIKEVLSEKKVKRDRCLRIADRKFDKPSAYKSGAVVRCRQGKIWKDLKEETQQNYSLELKKIIDNEYKIIAKIDGEVVGSLYFIKSKYKPALKATSVNVDPSFRRKGIGSKMYEFAEEKLKTKFIKSNNVLTADGKLLWDNPNRKFGTKNDLQEDESLHKWFKRSGPKGKEGGWVDCNAPDGKGGYKACGRKEGEKRSKYPACRPTPAGCKKKGKGKTWGKTK